MLNFNLLFLLSSVQQRKGPYIHIQPINYLSDDLLIYSIPNPCKLPNMQHKLYCHLHSMLLQMRVKQKVWELSQSCVETYR